MFRGRGINFVLSVYFGIVAVSFGLSVFFCFLVMTTVLDYLYKGDSWLDTGYFITDYQIALFTFVTGGLVCIVVGWRLARSVVAPLHAIGTAVQAITQGDLTARAADVKTAYGEAGALIHDFNAMAARLEQTEAELRYSNSAVAHELRTPLTILRGRLQGMADGVFPLTVQDCARLIRQVDDLSRLVEDLQTSSLHSAGHLSIHREELDLAAEIDDALEAIAPELEAAGLTVACRYGALRLTADGSRIRQAILAILDNARRYASPGRVEIDIEDRPAEAVVRFADSGPGLPEGFETRVFDRFWRADNSRSRASGGSGLGLAVVRAIAEAHGGGVGAYSRPEGGAVFEVCLPKAQNGERRQSAN